MKKIILGTFGALFGLQAHASGDVLFTLQDLEHKGINSDLISLAFQQKYGASLTNGDMLRVTYENEGSNLRFDTLDHLSVVIPILAASGSENKVGPGD